MSGRCTWTEVAQPPSVRAERSAASLLLAAGTIVPGRDADAVRHPGGADGFLEVDVVVAAHETGNETRVLGDDLSLRVKSLHEETRGAVAALGAVGDHVTNDEGAARLVRGRLPVERDRARVARDGASLRLRR